MKNPIERAIYDVVDDVRLHATFRMNAIEKCTFKIARRKSADNSGGAPIGDRSEVMDDGCDEQNDTGQALLAVHDVVAPIVVIVAKPVFPRFGIVNGYGADGENTGVVTPIPHGDEVIPELRQLLLSPGISTLVVGNAEKPLVENFR